MKLADLVDIECQFMRDAELDPAALRRRDRRIGRELEEKHRDRNALFVAWLQRLQPQREFTPGHLFESAYRWLRYLMILIGLLTGAGTASAVLQFDGTRPVNVVHFLAVFVGLQVLTLLLLLLTLLPSSIRKMVPTSGDFHKFLREIGYLASRLVERLWAHLPGKRRSEILADLQRLKVRHKLYDSLEHWLVIGLTQRFGVAFNLGALAACLYLITFSDLAFAWNTTLQVNSETFYSIVKTLAWPWTKIVPDAVPSPELVDMSRYFRIEGSYSGAASGSRVLNAPAVGGWWPFLVSALVFYGLLPRLTMLAIARLKLHRALKKLPLDSADFQSLHDRLTRPLVETRAPEPEKPTGTRATGEVSSAQSTVGAETCTLVLWGEIELPPALLERLVQHRFGWHIRQQFIAGGIEVEEDRRTRQAIAMQSTATEPILILAESWEAPGRAIRFFIRELRNVIPSHRRLVIGLTDTSRADNPAPPAQEDRRLWAQNIAALGDPYVQIEALVEAV